MASRELLRRAQGGTQQSSEKIGAMKELGTQKKENGKS